MWFFLHFTPSLRFPLGLQSAFYTQSTFYPCSAVCSPQSSFYTNRLKNIRVGVEGALIRAIQIIYVSNILFSAGRTRRQSVLITGWKVCDGPAQPICPFAKQLLDCKFAGSMTCKYSSRRKGFECPSVFNIIDCCTARCP